MTAADLFKNIDDLIEAKLSGLDSATKANYMARRAAILEATRKLWDSASVAPAKSAEIGNIVYVSKAEAFKYGRMDRLNDLVTDQARLGALTDISALEKHGVALYTTQYDGYAWAYQQGYALPVTGGAKVKLVARALYSDFYGAAFDETVRKNLGKFADDIISTVTRELNQGHSYTSAAKLLVDVTDTAYAKALRVARTEGGRIQSQAYLDSLTLLDEVGAEYEKMWDAALDDKTRADHQAMDGDMADKDGVFHLPDGSTGPAPRMTGVSRQDINCRCAAVTIINGQKPSERRIRGEGVVPYETYKDRLARGGSIPMRDVRAARPLAK